VPKEGWHLLHDTRQLHAAACTGPERRLTQHAAAQHMHSHTVSVRAAHSRTKQGGGAMAKRPPTTLQVNRGVASDAAGEAVGRQAGTQASSRKAGRQAQAQVQVQMKQAVPMTSKQ
jgi:hypothetical protein